MGGVIHDYKSARCSSLRIFYYRSCHYLCNNSVVSIEVLVKEIACTQSNHVWNQHQSIHYTTTLKSIRALHVLVTIASPSSLHLLSRNGGMMIVLLSVPYVASILSWDLQLVLNSLEDFSSGCINEALVLLSTLLGSERDSINVRLLFLMIDFL